MTKKWKQATPIIVFSALALGSMLLSGVHGPYSAGMIGEWTTPLNKFPKDPLFLKWSSFQFVENFAYFNSLRTFA